MSYKLPFSEIAEVVMGQSPSKEDVNSESNGFPLLNGPTEFTTRYPEPVQFTTGGKKFSQRDDILFCVRGSTTGRMNYSDQKYAIGRGIAAIRGKNGYPTAYIRAVLEQNLDRLLAAATGSTFPNVGRDLLLNFEVETISPEKAAIANDLIVALEDKIELNRQTNQTLESISQAIFKSWFVDFDPTRAKVIAKENDQDPELAAMAAIAGKEVDELDALGGDQLEKLKSTAALFPDNFEDTDIGAIPEGWTIEKVESIVKRLKPKKRYTKKQVQSYGAVPVYEQGARILLGYHNDDAGFTASPEQPIFIFGDHTCIVHLSCEDFDISSNVIPLVGNFHPTLWVYYAIQGKQEFQEYRRHWSEFAVKDIVTPDTQLSLSFSETVTNLYKQKEQLVRESKTLEQIRDSLLPKLLSGELEVASAN